MPTQNGLTNFTGQNLSTPNSSRETVSLRQQTGNNLENHRVTNDAPSTAQIIEFARHSMSVADRRIELMLGTVENHALILASTGMNLAGYRRMLDNYGVRHTLKQHGSPVKEAARGQIALTVEDFALIPQITAEPDAVFADGKNKIGRDVIVFTKVIDGIGYRHVEEVRSRHQLVATDSLRKKKGAWGS